MQLPPLNYNELATIIMGFAAEGTGTHSTIAVQGAGQTDPTDTGELRCESSHYMCMERVQYNNYGEIKCHSHFELKL